jgi:hypothetical protein
MAGAWSVNLNQSISPTRSKSPFIREGIVRLRHRIGADSMIIDRDEQPQPPTRVGFRSTSGMPRAARHDLQLRGSVSHG